MKTGKKQRISIQRVISLSIKEGKWLSIVYDSHKEKRDTSFWCYVQDIDPKTKTLYCDMYNDFKGTDTLEEIPLQFDRIKSALVLNFTTGGINEKLIRKINANLRSFAWLEYENFDNNILRYLELCCQMDGDPWIKDTALVEGIDSDVLEGKGAYELNESQMKQMGRVVRANDLEEWNSRYNELALSRLSIDIQNKKYIVAYEPLAFSPKERSIMKVGTLRLNPSFLIEGKKHSLSTYTEMTPEEFLRLLKENFLEASATIQESLRYNELIDTRPNFFCLSREYQVDLASLFEKIEQRWARGELEAPMRAFFGNTSYADNGKRKPGIVLFDTRVNADQAFAIYSALKNKATYVQGPPGTGKTCTIFNVILSCFFANKTVLVSTNNNRPLDSIARKLHFQDEEGEIAFPYLRLGNRQVNLEAINVLKKHFSSSYKPSLKEAELSALGRKVLEKNKHAVENLTLFMQRKSLLDNIAFLDKVSSLDAKQKIIKKEREAIQKKLAALPEVKEEEIIASFVSLSKDSEALAYLKEASLRYLSRLSSSKFDPLRKIVLEESPDKQVTALNSFLRNDANLALLTSAFPILFTTNLSSEKLGALDFLFDLVIMDEAGQADVARSLLPLSRGKSLLLVGDEDQLLPVVEIDPSLNESIRKKYEVSSTYDYLSNSILSTMKDADKVSNRILLRSHYRCGKKIITFNNSYFYGKQLRISPDLAEGEIAFCPSYNRVKTPLRNQNYQEAMNVVSYVKKYGDEDLAIITPFVNQANLINALLAEKGISKVHASTIHSVQGDEKNTVLISAGISSYSSKKTVAWLNNHGEIANVAVSRAKKKLVVFGDEDSLKKMSAGDGVWNSLFSYCHAKGKVEIVPPRYENWEIGKSNGSLTEDEFYATIAQIVSVRGNISMARNVPIKDVLGEEYNGDLREFDSVIYAKTLFSPKKPIFAFEFDGGEHYRDVNRIKGDKKKAEDCQAKGLRLIRVPNSYCKDYEYLKALIEDYSKDTSAGEQLTLF